ncbi:MFS transporter [Bradyrhizobium sp. U87765 SZCCT0131]|uniref:MFS transporter n=1 Tax=unclassified Bradyrhizobium TaxID=2631580 RepID=UPI001BAC0600|nr:MULTISPECIES: MFS transporter [unclassified Bradyrhizobium]MBR1218253.1 MFS transporter [Bradyrhizobium sp. U87765 SZCCT0131]MBR1260801.1 MFS transporter [Bradyrhizobium sp. U87765 SZCCT0134]MBR1303751.1 MFS transporter [Bradyrhizobium sp. U87765 SZCCT0110]MBR1319357.1 MFS transporter [Bradyrhizobium sp. U87765 SZCCT0109]MBR1347682.1 MFS transporter [Bradyrhizobium sp. U87765 SZCCT0048]
MSEAPAHLRADARSAIETSTMSAISWRVVPFLILAYFFSYLDRVNLGFAALTMNEELKFSPVVFSLGAGIFFFGYFLFEVPSNIILHKVGASRWIARIMVTWGIISALMALVSGTTSFYVLRFLLGVAEAGFFPGIILYLTYWYPAQYRARILAGFAIAVPVSTVIGAPISGLLLGLDGAGGLKGWQWLFILEGIPSILLGIVSWFYLTDRPAAATWLSAEQKQWLAGRLASEEAAKGGADHMTIGEALTSPRVLVLSLVYFGFVAALYGMQFWLPQIVKAFGLTNVQTGFVTAIPYLFGAIAMVLWGAHSDRTRERVWHVALPLFLTAAALAASSYLSSPMLTMIVLTIAAIGVFCTFALFWTLPTAFLSGTAAAGAIALINSIGNLAGFGGPYLIGYIKESTGSTSWGLFVLAVLPLIAGILVLTLKHDTRTEFAAEPQAR